MNAQTNQLDPLISEFATQADADSYDVWFRAKVQEALDSKKPRVPHDKAVAEICALCWKPEEKPAQRIYKALQQAINLKLVRVVAQFFQFWMRVGHSAHAG